MARGGGLRWIAEIDATGVEKGARQVERSMDRMEKVGHRSLTGLKVGALAAGAAIGTTLVAAARTGWQEFQEAEVASARLNTALKATGGSAGITRAELDRMNETLQRHSTLEGDVIQGAQALMLTYRNIGERVFPQATKAAIDMSRFFGKDLESATRSLGRALNDPVRGIALLTRQGITFTESQREQIKALVEAGKTQQAQAIILRQVNSAVGDAERRYSQTLPGAIDKAKRAYKDYSESAVRFAAENWPRVQEVIDRVVTWIRVNVAPGVREVVADLRRFWNEHEQDIRRVFGLVARTIQRVVEQVRDVARLISAIINGDWSRAWGLAKTIVGRIISQIGDVLKTLGPIALRAGKALVDKLVDGVKAAPGRIASGLVQLVQAATDAVVTHAKALGKKIVQAIVDGIKSLPGAVARAVRGLIPDDITPGFDFPGRATGGFIPGTYRGVDDQVALVASGEAILTPQQQAMIPGGRGTLARIFAATGGVTGGTGFAGGGWVNPVPGGNWKYGPGGGTHSRSERGYVWQDDDAWDIMGSDGTRVYAANDGVIGRVSPFNSDSRFWGHGLYLNVAGGQFFYKHLKSVAVKAGQRVGAGEFIGTLGSGVNGGPHLHLGANPSNLLSLARSGGSPGATRDRTRPSRDGSGPGDDAPPWRRDAPTSTPLMPGERRRLLSGGNLPPDTASDLVSDRHRDDRLQDSRTERAAETAARQRGVTNADKLALIREDAVAEVRIQELQADRADYETERGRVRARIAALQKGRKSWVRARENARTVEQEKRAVQRIADINSALRDARQAEKAITGAIADIDVDLALLGDENAIRDEQIAALPDQEPAAPTSDPGTSAGGADAGIPGTNLTAAQRAAIDYAGRADSFIRAITGTGDIGQGGRSALEAAGGQTIIIQALHPADSSTYRAIGKAAARAFDGQPYVSRTAIPSGA